MTTTVKHNPLLQSQLSTFIESRDVNGLLDFMNTLTHKELRTAGYLLGEVLLPTLSPDYYWLAFNALVGHSAKAYLGTFIKAFQLMYQRGDIGIYNAYFEYFAKHTATVVDRQKWLTSVFPLLLSPEEVRFMIDVFELAETEAKLIYLLKAGTLPCYYRLFQILKECEGDVDLLNKYVMLLVRKGDTLSFRLAGAIKDYFALQNSAAIFSLHVEPYKLSRLDASYTNFCKILEGH